MKAKQRKMSETEVTNMDVRGKDYHIEGNGHVIIIKKPAADHFPKSYVNPLKADLTLPSEVL